MQALKTVVVVIWVVFFAYWLISALRAKEGTRARQRVPLNIATAVAVVVLLRLFRGASLAVHSPVVGAIGAVVFAAGIATAVWARVVLGRDWGMPMTQKAEPELVTSGPYRLVRHPIYTGLLAALLGTALVTNLLGLAIVAVFLACFYYCASVEEGNLTAAFPTAYPAYRSTTKMLIPFVL
jgi:protein-S-isoprenylcysteine O-methyltransferase Ste14